MSKVVRLFIVRKKSDHSMYMTPTREWTDSFLAATMIPKHQADAITIPEGGELFEVKLGDIQDGGFQYSTVEIPVKKK